MAASMPAMRTRTSASVRGSGGVATSVEAERPRPISGISDPGDMVPKTEVTTLGCSGFAREGVRGTISVIMPDATSMRSNRPKRVTANATRPSPESVTSEIPSASWVSWRGGAARWIWESTGSTYATTVASSSMLADDGAAVVNISSAAAARSYRARPFGVWYTSRRASAERNRSGSALVKGVKVIETPERVCTPATCHRRKRELDQGQAFHQVRLHLLPL